MNEAENSVAVSDLPVKRQHNFQDLTGMVFGRWTVRHHVRQNGRTYWACVCECGQSKNVSACSLTLGKSVSCGCYKSESTAKAKTVHGAWSGGKESGAHKSWRNMMERCYRPQNNKFDQYGGRGIVVCERWHDFQNFLSDMGERPEGMTIERKHSDKNYEPANCIWATQQAQQNNRRNNRRLSIGEKTMTVAEWARETGIAAPTIYARIKNGDSDERALRK